MIILKNQKNINNEIHSFKFLLKEIKGEYFFQNNKVEPEYCLDKCEHYSGEYERSCPCRNQFHSCSGQEMDIRSFINKDSKAIIVAYKLSLNKKFDNEYFSNYFENKISPLPKRRTIFQKLEYGNKILWNLIKEQKTREKLPVFSFGPCKICPECTKPYGGECKNGPVYALERVGVRVDKLVEDNLDFSLEWLDLKEDKPTRPKDLCSVMLIITKYEDTIMWIQDFILKQMEKKIYE